MPIQPSAESKRIVVLFFDIGFVCKSEKKNARKTKLTNENQN